MYLELIDAGQLPTIDESGAAKLLVTSRALRLRRDHPELFTRYAPVDAVGAAASHVVAFDRGDAVTVATRLPLGLAAEGGWRDTAIVLAGRPVTDVLTGRAFAGGELPLVELLDRYPVALLVPSGSLVEPASVVEPTRWSERRVETSTGDPSRKISTGSITGRMTTPRRSDLVEGLA